MTDLKPTHGMVDISEKPAISREATAIGKVYLNSESLGHIKHGTNPKGDVLENAKFAAIHAVKKTPDLVFMCHPIRISSTKVHFEQTSDYIQIQVTVKTTDQTGVEIEALAGVMNGLLAIYDVSKRFEKDEHGLYPNARIEDVRVINKIKQ